MKRLISRKNVRTVLSLTALSLAVGVSQYAEARGGTAKPPTKNLVAPFVTATLPDPVFSLGAGAVHGLDVTGFIQAATTDGCGGMVKVNNLTITVPCNTVVQMPANTFKWADFVNFPANNPGVPSIPSLALGPNTYPSFEVQVVGNQVGSQLIAGLIFVSQQSLNGGAGYISRIDYTTGNIEVDSGVAGQPPVVIQINDPNGRFGRVQSPDPRFSVDDANPTIHAGTGYPMCVPRAVDATGATNVVDADGIPNDALCPQKNRPKPPCRNFSQAGIAPPASGELSPPAIGQTYCSQYVMKAVAGFPGTATLAASQLAGPTDADAREQAPFEVGDYIAWNGTLFKSAIDPTTGVAGPDFISAHTIEASVGIYTQPRTQPSYLAIGEFGVGTADPLATAVNGAAQETQDRIFLEASTTDVQTPVDIYMMDMDPVTGALRNRWVSPYELTGECNPAIAMPATCNGVSGGITTQYTGPQPQRARVRAAKSPAGLLSQPTRNLRVVARTLCTPTFTADQPLLDACIANAPVIANGLVAGQYAAPIFEYIFPENVAPGSPIVPFDMWHLPHLVNGEGPGAGPLTPAPW